MDQSAVANEETYILSLSQRVKMGDEYAMLIKKLWYKEFHAYVDFDDNRAQDGRDLRLEYGYTGTAFGPARCLEVLIALAERCAFTLQTYKADQVFKSFLGNLSLLAYDNDYCFGRADSAMNEIDEILNTWIDRKYRPNGVGGIFPLDNPEKDQREVELWYQMQSWIMEHS